jgi:hypothetical protein
VFVCRGVDIQYISVHMSGEPVDNQAPKSYADGDAPGAGGGGQIVSADNASSPSDNAGGLSNVTGNPDNQGNQQPETVSEVPKKPRRPRGKRGGSGGNAGDASHLGDEMGDMHKTLNSMMHILQLQQKKVHDVDKHQNKNGTASKPKGQRAPQGVSKFKHQDGELQDLRLYLDAMSRNDEPMKEQIMVKLVDSSNAFTEREVKEQEKIQLKEQAKMAASQKQVNGATVDAGSNGQKAYNGMSKFKHQDIELQDLRTYLMHIDDEDASQKKLIMEKLVASGTAFDERETKENEKIVASQKQVNGTTVVDQPGLVVHDPNSGQSLAPFPGSLRSMEAASTSCNTGDDSDFSDESDTGQ